MYYKPRALLVGSNPGVISRGKENDADEKVIDVNVTLWSYSTEYKYRLSAHNPGDLRWFKSGCHRKKKIMTHQYIFVEKKKDSYATLWSS